MNDSASDARFLPIFASWLSTLGQDAAALGAVVQSTAPLAARRYSAAGLNYLFKSLDLIPDGIDDLGFCDDAFVLRISAKLGVADGATGDHARLAELAEEACEVEAFLGPTYSKLVAYVEKLHAATVRGRTVDRILSEDEARSAFVHEVAAWAKAYEAPSFSRDPKTLLKLRSYLSAKLL